MKTRLNIYLSPGLHEEIAGLSAKRRVSKSLVIEAAIASMLSPDSADAREAAFVRRLDRHTRQLERVERDLSIAIETMALFVRFWLTVTPPLPESAQTAARAKGAERYRDFVETLGRRLQRGNSLVREISLEIWPEQRSNGVGSSGPLDPDHGAGEGADAG
jgi:hypothetical protein